MHHAIPYMYTYFYLGLCITGLLFIEAYGSGERKNYSPYHNACWFLLSWAIWPIMLIFRLLRKDKK